MYRVIKNNNKKDKEWSKFGSVLLETGNAVKQAVLADREDENTSKTENKTSISQVIPELYQLATEWYDREIAKHRSQPLNPTPPSYQGKVQLPDGTQKTKDELQQALDWTNGQYRYLVETEEISATLAELKNNLEAKSPDAPGYTEMEKQYEDLLKRYPSGAIFEELYYQREQADAQRFKLVSDIKYNFLYENPDYATQSEKHARLPEGFSHLRSFMNNTEIANYNYLYHTSGKKEAEVYMNYLESALEKRKQEGKRKEAQEFASDYHGWATLASVGSSLATPFEYLCDLADYGIEKIKGNKYAEVGYNESAMLTNTYRQTVTDEVDWEIGNWDAFDFLYNTTMSGVDSIAATTVFGPAGNIALGLSAAAQGTNDAIDRGMSNGQALWNGLFSGAFECVFESASLGQFDTLKEIPPRNVKDIFKNLGKSMLTNASEEMLTEITNIAYDTLVNGEFANYTLEELRNGAWKDVLRQVLEAGASGSLMGLGMGSIAGATAHVKQQFQQYRNGKNILNTDGGLDILVNRAGEVAEQSSGDLRQTLDDQINKANQKPTARSIGRLNQTVQTATNQATSPGTNQVAPKTSAQNVDQFQGSINQENVANQLNPAEVAERLKGQGIPAHKIDILSQAIIGRVNNQQLTKTQRDVLRSELGRPSVQKTINELMQKKANMVDSAQKNVYSKDASAEDHANNEPHTAMHLAPQGELASEVVTFDNAHSNVIDGAALQKFPHDFIVGHMENDEILSRPTWRQSELDAATEFPDYDAQKSFIDGKEVPYGTKGSVRPDYYRAGISVDVKNYDIGGLKGRRNLVRTIERQYSQRVENLPHGTQQIVMIDMRGQKIEASTLVELYNDIIQKTSSIEILFKIR